MAFSLLLALPIPLHASSPPPTRAISGRRNDSPPPSPLAGEPRRIGRREVMLRSSGIATLAAIFHFSGTKPSYLGVQKSPPSLALCPATNNCISTSEEISDTNHYSPPWLGGPDLLWLRALLISLPIRNVLRNTTLVAESDGMDWRWSKNGKFCVMSAYSFLVNDGLDDRRILQLWYIKAPLRIKIFLWLAARNRLLTADRLIKRGLQGPNFCVCCYGDEETLDHLLFQCHFARSVWSRILQGNQFRLSTLHRGTGDLADKWKRLKLATAQRDQDHLDECVAATCWELWMERNYRIFENKTSSLEECTRRILNTLTLWRKALMSRG